MVMNPTVQSEKKSPTKQIQDFNDHCDTVDGKNPKHQLSLVVNVPPTVNGSEIRRSPLGMVLKPCK